MKYILTTLFFALLNIFNLKAQSTYWTSNGMTAILSVDEKYNYDLTATIKITFPENHNVSKYRYSYAILSGPCPKVPESSIGAYASPLYTLASRTAPTTATFNVSPPSINNRLRFTIEVVNSQGQISALPTNGCSPFDVYFITKVLLSPTLSFDSIMNYDRTYKMTISIPKNANVRDYRIFDGNNKNNPISINSSLANDCTFIKTHIFRFQNNGQRKWRIIAWPKGIPSTCGNYFAFMSGNYYATINYTAPPPPVPIRCSPTVVKIIDRNYSNFTYNFPSNSNCTNQKYISKFYRCLSANGLSPYDSTLTSSQVQSLGLTAPAFKNFDTNNEGVGQILTLTTQEKTQGFFQRKVTPILTVSDCWYKIEVICSTCTDNNTPAVKYVYVKKK